jgi:hypothetical protein
LGDEDDAVLRETNFTKVPETIGPAVDLINFEVKFKTLSKQTQPNADVGHRYRIWSAERFGRYSGIPVPEHLKRDLDRIGKPTDE